MSIVCHCFLTSIEQAVGAGGQERGGGGGGGVGVRTILKNMFSSLFG